MLENPIQPVNLLHFMHPRLPQHLKPGMQVLDVGCGDGRQTQEMLEGVLPGGKVVGFDQHLTPRLETATGPLEGVAGDVYHLPFHDRFDVVNARKLLGWLDRPIAALQQMVQAAAPGGKVVVLEMSCQPVIWNPALPPSVQKYHVALSQWRTSIGCDESIGERLPELFRKVGLVEILVVPILRRTPQNDTFNDPHFEYATQYWSPALGEAGGWAEQVCSSGHLSELEREQAEHDFELWKTGKWLEGAAVSILSPLVTVEGTKSY
jgi:ubiquinone/menaquinone biosynthesis C-methylase UbiE